MRFFLLMIAVAALAALSGCMKITTEVYVKKDGSGTITETMLLSKAVSDMVKSMAAAFGSGEGSAFSEADLRAKASQYGEGVSLVSAEELTGKNGEIGSKAVYSFSDVTQLRVGTDVIPADMAGARDSLLEDFRDTKPMTFGFVGGKTPKLTIKIPRNEMPNLDSLSAGLTAAMSDTAGLGAMRGKAKEYGDMGAWIRVKVEGKIKKTNADHVNTHDNGLTLIKVDFAAVFEHMVDPAELYRLVQDPSATRELEKKIPGLMVQKNETITVEFE